MVSKWFMVSMLVATVSVEAQAARDAVVEGVNMPAWVTRGNAKQPLAVGESLRPADEVTTATGSRVILRLGDGSAVKLGENARFVVAAAGRPTDERGLYRASLRVLQGAFRFTTSALAKVSSKRDVDIRLPAVTIGIRGTDLWGKADGSREFVVLIEGRVAVQRGSEPEVTMDQPRTIFDAPTGAPTPPLAVITQEELGRLALETELRNGSGAATSGGVWKVQVAVARDQNEALAAWDRLSAAGYAAALAPRNTSEGIEYRVRINRFASRADAEAVAKRLAADLGFGDARATR